MSPPYEILRPSTTACTTAVTESVVTSENRASISTVNTLTPSSGGSVDITPTFLPRHIILKLNDDDEDDDDDDEDDEAPKTSLRFEEVKPKSLCLRRKTRT